MSEQEIEVDVTPSGDEGAATGLNKEAGEQEVDVSADGGSDGETGVEVGKEDADSGDVGSKFPDNWREELGGEDEKLTKLLGRYSTPHEVAKALREANSKLSKKFEIKSPNSKDASEDDVKKWQEAMNVPEKAEDYKIELSNGYMPGEEDKEMVSLFLDKMHSVNSPPEYVNSALEAYYELQEQMNKNYEAVNLERKSEAEEVLRSEYGRDYKGNMNAAVSFLDKTFGTEGANAFENAVGGDGIMLMHNPDFIRGVVNMALLDNPVPTMPKGITNLDALNSEIADIESKIGTPAYYKNDGMQSRYAELLASKEKLS